MDRKQYGIYLHIPFCKSRCDYCGFVSSCDFTKREEYFGRLCREIGESEFSGTFDTLFVGGGTPSVVGIGFLESAVHALDGKFAYVQGAECSVECNPDSLDGELLERLLELGFNRYSIGVQSFSDSLLKNVGRRHTGREALLSLELVRSRFENVSVDLMLGLPGQRKQDVKRDLDILKDLDIPHVSAYGLKVEEGTKLFDSGYRPDEDFSAELYDIALDSLAARGVERYEVSNFAKPGFECRHNLKYWRREDYVGFGAAAHSCVGNRRFSNADSLSGYLAGESGTSDTLSAQEVEYERIILALRTREGLDRRRFEADFGCDFERKYARAIQKCGKYLEISENFIRVSPEGFYLLNALLVHF